MNIRTDYQNAILTLCEFKIQDNTPHYCMLLKKGKKKQERNIETREEEEVGLGLYQGKDCFFFAAGTNPGNSTTTVPAAPAKPAAAILQQSTQQGLFRQDCLGKAPQRKRFRRRQFFRLQSVRPVSCWWKVVHLPSMEEDCHLLMVRTSEGAWHMVWALLAQVGGCPVLGDVR